MFNGLVCGPEVVKCVLYALFGKTYPIEHKLTAFKSEKCPYIQYSLFADRNKILLIH